MFVSGLRAFERCAHTVDLGGSTSVAAVETLPPDESLYLIVDGRVRSPDMRAAAGVACGRTYTATGEMQRNLLI